MKQAVPKRQRCAIYTRKSTEHNLDLAFNSLDAQREACEAYIKSQAHEGWTLVRDHFDDGGLSGASLDRPALQGLLDAVRAKKVDIIVVYKVDRLTRSLADFAKLVELFDEHDVSFVSVTQSFNTTSSMGRLTLNVLLSFAQFEREVIGERVRDKIAASKRKGLWVGGPVPLGYRSVDKKLEIVAVEADLVRKIFSDYLRLGSVGALAASLTAEGLRPKPRQVANGKTLQASCYRVGPLAHLLKNRFYIGEVVYRGEVNPGEHDPILDRDLFEAVQAKLADQRVQRKIASSRSPHLLTGKLFDDRGNLMSPTHANKAGIRYRYYVSQAVLQGRKADAGSISRVAAPDVEQVVLSAIPEPSIDRTGAEPTEPSDRRALLHLVDRVTIGKGKITVVLCREDESADSDSEQAIDESPNILTLPFESKCLPRKGVLHEPSGPETIDPKARQTLLAAIARSCRWMDEIASGTIPSLDAIATAEGLVERYVRRLSVLAWLSPKVITAIVNGTAPADLTISGLTQALPQSWPDQEAMFLRG